MQGLYVTLQVCKSAEEDQSSQYRVCMSLYKYVKVLKKTRAHNTGSVCHSTSM